jgi:hypothetical protein
MAKWRLVRAFKIDDGQLDGMSPQNIFTLGYELALFDEALKRPEAFEMLIHADNFDRMLESLKTSGRGYESSWMSEDKSETWMTLNVKERAV